MFGEKIMKISSVFVLINAISRFMNIALYDIGKLMECFNDTVLLDDRLNLSSPLIFF